MKFSILTLFPEIIHGYFQSSIMSRAIEKGLMSYEAINFRQYASGNYQSCDDKPYGGGAGMLLKPEPLAAALDELGAKDKMVIYPSPSGSVFDQHWAWRLSQLGQGEAPVGVAAGRESIPLSSKAGASQSAQIIFICGRYEGLDQRIIDEYVDQELTIGDYVLSSGELSSLCMIDAIYRLAEGVICAESLEDESFNDGLLEYPQYTRPEVFKGREVPEVLRSGHHEEIRRWRLEQSLLRTFQRRPDLWGKRSFTKEETKICKKLNLS